ncbi:MAG: SDR family NAD(P)-dependent oxidoreductase [Candidatus Eisenbacteria bacterium]
MSPPRTALVTGGAAGIGIATGAGLARLGYRVILTARTREQAERAARGVGESVRGEALDVAHPDAAGACAHTLAATGIHVDVLVNNAAIYPDEAGGERGVLDSTSDDWHGHMETNFFGALWSCRAFAPGMVARGFGRIVNVSSDYGSYGAGLLGPAPYSVSKAALNALTIKLAAELRPAANLKVNAVHPGWVRTAMGGPGAHRSPTEGAATVIWLATLPAEGPTGGFFHDQKPFPW